MQASGQSSFRKLRGVLALALAAVLSGLWAVPLAAASGLAAPELASCCKRSAHACCKRGKTSAGLALTASNECGNTCSRALQTAAPAPAFAIARNTPEIIIGTVAQAVPELPAARNNAFELSTTLHQRPPPGLPHYFA